MKLGDGGHGGDDEGVVTAAELGELMTGGRVDVDEARHVADAEFLLGGL